MTVETSIPRQPLGALFLRFLRFGFLAWGGPVAQIAMIKQELVVDERWISPERFNRALAIYQVLPGPEAHELCVYFGMLARGRIGGFLAGLGFMLPGFVLMLSLSWLYVSSQGTLAQDWGGVFLAAQAAVIALIVRAVHRIGTHAIHDVWLLAIAIASFAGSLAGLHFSINLVAAGILYWSLHNRGPIVRTIITLAWIAAIVTAAFRTPELASTPLTAATATVVSLPALFYSGLKGGLLTFGGAYTVIPFLQRDAVVVGGWMTNDQFLDGLALSGVLPAPLIIFATFVGYIGGRLLGSVTLTTGIFLPAFGFTLAAHEPLENITQKPNVHRFLDGVTAGVVGLIAATTVLLAPPVLSSLTSFAVFGASLSMLYLLKHRLTVLLVIAVAVAAGAITS